MAHNQAIVKLGSGRKGLIRSKAPAHQVVEATKTLRETSVSTLAECNRRGQNIHQIAGMCQVMRAVVKVVQNEEVDQGSLDADMPPKIHPHSQGGTDEANTYIRDTLSRCRKAMSFLYLENKTLNARMAAIESELVDTGILHPEETGHNDPIPFTMEDMNKLFADLNNDT